MIVMQFVVTFTGNPLPIFDIPYAGFQDKTVVEYKAPWQRKWRPLPAEVWGIHIENVKNRAMLFKKEAVSDWLDTTFGARSNRMFWDGLIRITIHQEN